VEKKMNIVDQATQTQLSNIEKRTGKSLKQLFDLVGASGLNKPGQVRDMLKSELGLGFGDAAVLASTALKALSPDAEKKANQSIEEIVAGFYSGPRSALRPIHDRVMAEMKKFGEFEIAPKKTYLSLRRKRQFAMLGPATNSRIDLGLNMKGIPATQRLLAMPPGGMCQYQVRLSSENDVDSELIDWIKQAYESAA
jgi:hypothetical protein